MRIQVLTFKNRFKDYENKYFSVVNSTFDRPQSFDSFDLNLISLTDESMWRANSRDYTHLNNQNDLISLQTQINLKDTSVVIIQFPTNKSILYDYEHYNCRFNRSILIKDALVRNNSIFSGLIPESILAAFHLTYGLDKTKCNNSVLDSEFTFCNHGANALSKTQFSNKDTTILLFSSLILTTLQFSFTNNELIDFLSEIGMLKTKEDYPEWLVTLESFDDKDIKDEILKNEMIIEKSQETIEKCNVKFEINMRYKSILIETGQNLVDIVFEMLEEMLEVDLSKFVDTKKEDFRFTANNITFLGEIKGINSNVKSTYVSQTNNHYFNYIESNDFKGEEVKRLLIINPLRDKPINEREPINEEQISLAYSYDCLIITTERLLKLYEKYKEGTISSSQIFDSIIKSKGLFDCEIL